MILSGKLPVSDGPICRYEAEFAVIITLFAHNLTMALDKHADGRIPILKLRSLGIAIVALIYFTQWIALSSIDPPLQQRFSSPLIILGVGWLSSGLVLGRLVLNRSCRGWRYAYGLAAALFLSVLFVAGIKAYISSIPPTYIGP